MPGISEQFAGMGSGGLSSSGFRNAAVQGATDLSERLGSMREQLRMQGAQGLQNIGTQYLNPVTENVMHQGQPGIGQPLMQGVGGAIPGMIAGGPMGGAMGFMNGMSGGGNKTGANTSWAGQNGPQASPRMQLPNRSF